MYALTSSSTSLNLSRVLFLNFIPSILFAVMYLSSNKVMNDLLTVVFPMYKAYISSRISSDPSMINFVSISTSFFFITSIWVLILCVISDFPVAICLFWFHLFLVTLNPMEKIFLLLSCHSLQ